MKSKNLRQQRRIKSMSKMKNDDFGNRMKKYEKSQIMGRSVDRETGKSEPIFVPTELAVSSDYPVFVRLDGKAFHTWTKNFKKPFDKNLSNMFAFATKETCSEIGQVLCAYSQSDEVTFLLSGWNNPDSQIWFGGKIQKIVSVISSIFTAKFNSQCNFYTASLWNSMAFFDARVWNVPVNEIENVFIWRQMDARRNSISGLAQSLFSHKELQGLKSEQLKAKCYNEKGIDWNELPEIQKWGFVVKKENYEIAMADGNVMRSRGVVDDKIPYFIDNKNYLKKILTFDKEEE